MVTYHLTSLLQRLDTTHIQSDRGIELQGTTTGCCLWITEHHADLLTELVDEDDDTVRLTDNCGQLTQCLRHQTRLKTYMRITHVTFDLRLRNKCCNRVDDDNVYCTGTDHRLCDLQRLFSVIRLGDI